MGRSEDAIAVYDDLLARFGSATELPLREQVASALLNKGVQLGALGRSEDELAVYERFIRSLCTSDGTVAAPSCRQGTHKQRHYVWFAWP